MHYGTVTFQLVCVLGWLDRVPSVDGVGTYLLYKYNQKLFRRNTIRSSSGETRIRGSSSNTLYECEFTNDMEGGGEWLVIVNGLVLRI